MARYSVAGKGSRILARLDESEATRSDLVEAALGSTFTRRKYLRACRVIDALKRDALIQIAAGFYHLTVEGRDALVCLRSGRPAVIETAVPSCRVFAERRAA